MSIKIQILFKVNDRIISNVDIFNEANYLRVLNKELENLDQNKLLKIAIDEKKDFRVYLS